MNHYLGSAREISESRNLGGETSAHCAGTILYVEDEPFVREVTAEVLRAAGYRVLVARNAAEAIDMFQGWGSDVELLLTDVILPGESGRVLAGRLRRANSPLNVLYVTGYAEHMGIRSMAHEDCLAKPFSTDALLEKVRRMMNRPDIHGQKAFGAMLACVGA